MSRLLVRTSLAVLAAVCCLWLTPGAGVQASGSEQIVFSGTGYSPDFGPFGFWVWCQNSNPGSTVYNGDCAGSMYVYEQATTKAVSGTVTESSGIYTMTVASRDGVIAATLENVSAPVNGPKNTIIVNFTSPVVGTGTVTNAVFKATGN